MSFANEILDAIEIMVRQVVEDNTTKIYTGVCKSITTTTCTLTINGKDNTVKYYGGTPIVGTVYQVFIPFGNMSAAFIIVPGSSGGTVTGVTSVNGKTGTVVLNANDVGALPNTTTIPTKTSELDNDSGFIDNSALDGYAKTIDIPTKTSQLTNNSGFITSAQVPVTSVNTKTGAVNLVKSDIGLSNVDNVKQYSTSNPPPYPVTSVNNKTGAVVLDASDVGALPDTTIIPVVNNATLDVQRNGISVGTFTANASTDKTISITVPTKASDVSAVSTSDVTTTLGTSTTKVPSEKAVSDAIGAAGGGDMLKSTYDPNGVVETAGGIPNYVKSNTVAKTGDTMTGTLAVGSASLQTNGYVTGTWLRGTANNHMANTSAKVAVLDGSGWVYYRTVSELFTDLNVQGAVKTALDEAKQYCDNAIIVAINSSY